MMPSLAGPLKRKTSVEVDTKSNEPVQKYSRTNVKSGSISTCTITKPVGVPREGGGGGTQAFL